MVKSLRAAPLRTAGEKDSRTIKAALDRRGTLTQKGRVQGGAWMACIAGALPWEQDGCEG